MTQEQQERLHRAESALAQHQASMQYRWRAFRITMNALGAAVAVPVILVSVLAFAECVRISNRAGVPRSGASCLKVSSVKAHASRLGARIEADVCNASNQPVSQYVLSLKALDANGDCLGSASAVGRKLEQGESQPSQWHLAGVDAQEIATYEVYLQQAKDSNRKVIGRYFFACLK